MKDTKFKAWIKEVDYRVSATLGLSIYDLEDQPYREWFDDGLTVRDAAEEVLDVIGDEYGIDFF